jgi:3-mercaptopropionate dioxygenase
MLAPLRQFVCDFTALADNHAGNEVAMRTTGAALLRTLVAQDDWLPEASAAADPTRYQQHLLWCDPHQRFSVVSFVWGPGQHTPVHDHTVWGLIGMLRGAETEQRYERDLASGDMIPGATSILKPGEVAAVSPTIGDVHEVRNALADRPSISIHVYGANIGAVHRHVFDLAHHARKDFVSGYSAVPMPNIWH